MTKVAGVITQLILLKYRGENRARMLYRTERREKREKGLKIYTEELCALCSIGYLTINSTYGQLRRSMQWNQNPSLVFASSTCVREASCSTCMNPTTEVSFCMPNILIKNIFIHNFTLRNHSSSYSGQAVEDQTLLFLQVTTTN